MSKTTIEPKSKPRADDATAVPPGYKRTEVGVIPEDWNVKTISELADVKTGPFGSSLHERDYVDDGTPIITVEHLSEHGIVHNNLPMVSDSDRSRLKSYCLRQDDIVFSRVGSVDRNSLVGKAEDGWLFSGRLLRVRMSGSAVHPPYLSYHFHSEPFKQRIRGVAVGQTMASLNTQILKRVSIVLPSAGEQRAIAEALSDVDGLIEALDKLIAKKRAIKQAAMQQLLTGKTHLPGFSGEWETKRLGDIVSLYQPVTISAKSFMDSGYPVYGANGVVGFYNQYNHEKWQVTVTCRGSTCGTVNKTVEKCWITGNAMVVNCDDNASINKNFLYYALLSQDLSECITGTGQPQIVRGALAKYEISIPREIAEQTTIATVLSDMDAEIEALERRRDKTRQIKQGMMQQLLTGRVRLVKPELEPDHD